MKRQIRKNVFETNSSTQHTITICNKSTDFSRFVGTTIVLGKNVDCDKILYNENVKRDSIVKLNQLWISLLNSDTSIYEFMVKTNFIKNTLNKIGIHIEISNDPKDYKWAHEHRWYGDIDDANAVINFAFNSEEDLINFVFNEDSWYDSYEDNYQECPYEKDIKPGNKTEWYRNG